MSDVSATIADYIRKEFVPDGSDVDVSKVNLLEEEIIDSLGIFTMLSFIEDRFGVTIDPEEVVLENFQTVSAMTSLIESKL